MACSGSLACALTLPIILQLFDCICGSWWMLGSYGTYPQCLQDFFLEWELTWSPTIHILGFFIQQQSWIPVLAHCSGINQGLVLLFWLFWPAVPTSSHFDVYDWVHSLQPVAKLRYVRITEIWLYSFLFCLLPWFGSHQNCPGGMASIIIPELYSSHVGTEFHSGDFCCLNI